MSTFTLSLVFLALAAVGLLPAMSSSQTGANPVIDPARGNPMPPTQAEQKIVPFLWFTKEAEDALRFYTGIFPDAKIVSESRWGDGGPLPKGTLMTATVRLAGVELILLNGGPAPKFSDALSLFIRCDTQPEIDMFWEKLTAGGGEPGPCGWLKDKFGVSWQVVPRQLGAMFTDKDTERAKRVGAAVMKMGKLDIEKLQKAYDGR
jgi:predicted 3-demethylubiquinone-9 3-methyltransferase (glyoxalase superfamily)